MTRPLRITIRGARQHNLKNIDLDLPQRRLIVVTGPSGSGKSSLAFDTIYAEGQRRYMASLSTYAKQFLEKIDKPDVDEIVGIAPTIAIQQKNPVKHSRSTVGTATEIYDYLRLAYAKVGKIHCPECGKVVEPDTIPGVQRFVSERLGGERALVTYPVQTPTQGGVESLRDILVAKGYIRILVGEDVVDLSAGPLPAVEPGAAVDAVVDRLKLDAESLSRLAEALEAAFREGQGYAGLKIPGGAMHRFSQHAECCGRRYARPAPQLFSFNNPRGACEECKGFGNSLDLDLDLIVPNKALPLSKGAVDPWAKPSYLKWQRKLVEAAKRRGIDVDKSWRELKVDEKRFIWEGDKSFGGIVGFFEGVGQKKYKLHKRVFLRRYQTEVVCRTCAGTRLKPDSLYVRVAGKNIAEATAMTIGELVRWTADLPLTDMERAICKEALAQVRSRLEFLDFVGLSYLTLSRMTRTLSGGESQRIQLANQLGARLSGTLYVLDEPSIGLHPRDNQRLVTILRRLVERGNTVIVVEHDRDMIESADYVVELGPGSGESGGEVVFSGEMEDYRKTAETATAEYLRGREMIAVPDRRRAYRRGNLEISGAVGHNLKRVD
ncbi:MAG: excinuclease ABC subunit A, partial [Candidatus Methylomirabilis sp.]|nr:excinuclease ABC subunit A [Deltaproteobacteria bacterium]